MAGVQYYEENVLSQVSEVQNQPETPKKKTKRTRNPDNWKKEKRKRAILSGQSYLNTKGDLVHARTIGPDCVCKLRCFGNVSGENRAVIFNGYYALKSYDEQNAYLYGLIRRYDIQRKRKPNTERRTCSYKYYVRIKGKEVPVCKKAFASIHGISDKKIRTLCIKHEQNVLFPRDNRGRHNNRPKKVTPELVIQIKKHILKILSGPDVKEFIKTDKSPFPDVNISKLHKSFLMEYEPEAIDSESDKVIKDVKTNVKSWLYFKVFHEEFNSMDFHTVKRKLPDLRKSLEVNGSLPPSVKKKSSPKTTSKTKGKTVVQKPVKPLEQSHYSTGPLNCPTSLNTSVNYEQNGQQQPSNFTHNLQLNMLGLPHVNNTHQSSSQPTIPHLQQQPLNLRTNSGLEQPTPNQNSQSFPLNFPSMGHNPMSSYYLCFGQLPELIPLPVLSSPSQTHNYQSQNLNFYNTPNFSHHPNSQLPSVSCPQQPHAPFSLPPQPMPPMHQQNNVQNYTSSGHCGQIY